jgi:hypothetical protein
MNFPTDNIIRERFARNGVHYDCTIAPKGGGCKQFQVLLVSSEENDFLTFNIMPSGDGHWLPDNTRRVDPWLADIIGNIIIDNY